jgi:hypothetical protein
VQLGTVGGDGVAHQHDLAIEGEGMRCGEQDAGVGGDADDHHRLDLQVGQDGVQVGADEGVVARLDDLGRGRQVELGQGGGVVVPLEEETLVVLEHRDRPRRAVALVDGAHVDDRQLLPLCPPEHLAHTGHELVPVRGEAGLLEEGLLQVDDDEGGTVQRRAPRRVCGGRRGGHAPFVPRCAVVMPRHGESAAA